MTTKLLKMVHDQDQQALADRYNGEDRRQPRRVWCVEALKPELTEQEYDAAKRAVRECILYFPGAKANMDRVDMAWSDAGMARQMDAGHALYGLLQGVTKRCERIGKAAQCAEWIVQLYTLQDIASAMGHWRRMGPSRDQIPDVRSARPFVRLVLIGMASYYADCDAGAESWRGRAA